jgi:hypothetical protein
MSRTLVLMPWQVRQKTGLSLSGGMKMSWLPLATASISGLCSTHS